VRKQTQALFLQNNFIRTLGGLRDTLDEVMFNPDNLLWLDLSYNYLENIEDELLKFTQLKTLYLHGNYFSNMEQVRKLNQFEDLQSLTLYANPIEQVTNYRLWVLGVMYEYTEELRRLDQVLVTNREYDKVLVWRNLHIKEQKKLKNLKIQQPKKPPQQKTEEDDKKAQTGTA
jgi:Leucine-rich repeat (LRR) protein